jgi:hypothetical protein
MDDQTSYDGVICFLRLEAAIAMTIDSDGIDQMETSLARLLLMLLQQGSMHARKA